MLRRPVMLVFASILLASPAAHSVDKIEWEVSNRFPLFQFDESFQKLASAWMAQSPSGFLSQQNDESLREILPIHATWWDAKSGTYNRTELFRRTHRVIFRYTGVDEGKMCVWTIDGKGEEEKPCNETITVELNEDAPFKVLANIDRNKSTQITGTISTELIIAFGDSFASGEGNPDYAVTFRNRPGYTSIKSRDWFLKRNVGNFRFKESAEWWDNACHRSLLSWQALYAMDRAVADKHRVVRFASFACSGGEVYDGFFRAQTSPPGTASRSDGITTSTDRDGGLRYVQNGDEFVKVRDIDPKLIKSQLNAAVFLLCDGDVKKAKQRYSKPSRGLSSQQVHYGDFTYYQCFGNMQKPTRILISFGGNDFGFAGVVKWAIVPDTSHWKMWEPILRITREIIGAVNPSVARMSAERHLATLYNHLEMGLKEVLRADTDSEGRVKNVYALIYPDPLPVKDFAECAIRLRAGNEALGQYVRSKLQSPFNRMFSGWVYGFEKPTVDRVRKKFIVKFKELQLEAIERQKWIPVESDVAFLRSSKSFCSAKSACAGEGRNCPDEDRFAWAQLQTEEQRQKSPKGKEVILPLLGGIDHWEAYDSNRSRALRTANDAVLTQARFPGDPSFAGRIFNDEWVSGIAHPTATAHSDIATHLIRLVECSENARLCN